MDIERSARRPPRPSEAITILLQGEYVPIANGGKTQPMRNSLISIFVASARRRELRPDAHVAELRSLFSAACRFGLTRTERDEWQARFDIAIAALEAQIAASEDAVSVNARRDGRLLRKRLMTALPARAARPETAQRAV
jgi:hypothetical protein